MMMRGGALATASLFTLASMPILAPTPAEAWFKHGAGSGSCLYAVDNGCAAANPNGILKDVTLLTSAQQMGQNSLLPTHPMNFNIPGVDYAIGPDKTLTPQDPRTITANGTTPCAYIGTGANAPPNDFVGCFGAGTFPNAVLDNYDFSGTKIGKSALILFVNSDASAGSKLTVTNSYFSIPPSGGGPLGFNSPAGGSWSIKFWNNQCDGTNATASSNFCFDDGNDASPNMSFDARYNILTNQGVGRVGGGFTRMSFTLRYNYITGLNSLNTGNHGELMQRNCSGALRKNCQSFDDYEGNFIVWPPGTVTGVDNGTIFPGDGSPDGVNLSSVTFDNNIVVTNSLTGGNGVINQAMFAGGGSNMGAVDLSGNYIDASGSDDCSINGAKSGGNSVTASQTGNVVNVTGLSGSFGTGVEPGFMFFRSGGYTTTHITSFGTATGSTGTYNVDGPSQSVGTDSLWTLVPGFSSLTANGNYGLADPSHTGVPVALGISGPQMTAAHCPPHY